ncbi:unnamed protein product, partial [Prorocentrum cordatum]
NPGFLSWLFFLWVGRLVSTSGQGPVEDEHLVEVPGASRVAPLLARFDAVWRPEGRDEKETSSLLFVTRQLFLPAWGWSGFLMFMQQLISVIIPFLTEESSSYGSRTTPRSSMSGGCSSVGASPPYSWGT